MSTAASTSALQSVCVFISWLYCLHTGDNNVVSQSYSGDLTAIWELDAQFGVRLGLDLESSGN